MFKYIFLLFFLPVYSFAVETVKVVEVLKGDTVVVSLFRGEMKYVHLVGIDAPELNQEFGSASRAYLAKLVLNKTVMMETVQKDDTHYISRLYISNKDVGAEVLTAGMAWAKTDERPGMSSVQRSSYKLLADNARYKKIGLWKNADVVFGQNPESFRQLDRDKYNQQYINGTDNPRFKSFNRPVLEKKKQKFDY